MNALINAIFEILSLPFMRYALIAGPLIALVASLLGVTLVLKRYSMIGDGLSHVSFGALAVATVLQVAPLHLALPVTVVAAVVLLRLSEKGKLKGDALTAMISTGSLAVGVLALSLSSGMNVDVYNYMFGSIFTLTRTDVILAVLLALVVIPLYILLFPRLFSITFDRSFARASGLNTSLYDTVMAILTALTIVLGMRLMGTLLISALIVFPPLTAMRVAKSFSSVAVLSAILPVVSFLCGLCLSFFCSTPPGASVVIINLLFFAIFSLISLIRNKVKK